MFYSLPHLFYSFPPPEACKTAAENGRTIPEKGRTHEVASKKVTENCKTNAEQFAITTEDYKTKAKGLAFIDNKQNLNEIRCVLIKERFKIQSCPKKPYRIV